ncbi:signal peptidase I [uncultured Kocuria sp.]|uniref:signal peptidase I n=1 Tax=uncultured Kocuria sp. TaxID=259305 RepID=UPI00259AD1C8|nr:signal peptidase I [uncultured Kocuria sp.]MCT1367379.1 signal peptidase I [Rothia sp. p3-SID1597]
MASDQNASADDSLGGSTVEESRTARRAARRDKKQEPEGLWPKIKEILLVIFYALIIAFIVKTFLIRGFYIPSGSMENTLELNDRIFVNVAGNYLSDPDRGDIVVFKDSQHWIPENQSNTSSNPIRDALSFVGVLPDSSQNYLIKRVIGKGGDHVTCCSADGKVQVNGKAIDESSYLYPGAKPSDFPFDVTVPEGEYFVMGDHRNASADSRYHIQQGTEFVKRDDIEGRAFITAWPISRWTWLDSADNVFSDIPGPKATNSDK